MEIQQPYLLFLGDAPDDLAAKTAFGVFDWRPAACVGQVRLPGCVPRLEIPEMSVEEEARRCLKDLEVKHGLDCVDPVRTGVGHIVERILAA